MPVIRLRESDAPSVWTRPGGERGQGQDLLGAVEALGAGEGVVHLLGGEPTRHPELVPAMTTLTERGWQCVVHTTLPGHDDDRKIRPYATTDVRFRVTVPAADPEGHAEVSGDPAAWDEVLFGLRNLRAFAYPFDLAVPVTAKTVERLASTVETLWREMVPGFVELDVLEPSEDVIRTLDAQLLRLQGRHMRPTVRLITRGLPRLALAVQQHDDLDVRVGGDLPGAPTPVLDLPVPGLDGAERARREVALDVPLMDRPGHRGDRLDRWRDAVSVVLIRPGNAVYGVIHRRREGLPRLAETPRFGLSVIGRFEDPTLASRWASLCRQVHGLTQAEEGLDLAGLRHWAHILRRSMKPMHDGAPAVARGEGGVPLV